LKRDGLSSLLEAYEEDGDLKVEGTAESEFAALPAKPRHALDRLQAATRRAQVQIKELLEAHAESQEAHEQQADSFDDLKDSHSAHHDRLLIVEKLLEFTSLQQQPLDFSELENRLNKRIEEQYAPTQQRVLELQSQMGDIARLVKVDQDSVIKALKAQVEEALGTGRGTDKSGSIKSVCLEAVATQCKEINRVVRTDIRDCYKKCMDQSHALEAVKESLNKWREVQDKNTEVVADLQKKTLTEREAIEELMNS